MAQLNQLLTSGSNVVTPPVGYLAMFFGTNNTLAFKDASGNLIEPTGSLNSVSASLAAQAQALTPGDKSIEGSLTITGTLTAKEYIVSSSVTNIIELNSSGSTVFGNSLDDTHQNTGSLLVTGSAIIEGDTTITGSLTIVTNTGIEFQVTNTGTKIGNTITDTHAITGSLSISGSLISTAFTGSITGSIGQFSQITGSTLLINSTGSINRLFVTNDAIVSSGSGNITVGNGGIPQSLIFGSTALTSLPAGYNWNTAIGLSTLSLLGNGNNNTALGKSAGTSITTGSDNTYLGYAAGNTHTSGSNNTIIGASATIPGFGSNNTVIGKGISLSNGTNSNIAIGDGQGNIRARYSSSWTLDTGVSSSWFSGSFAGSIVGNITGSITGSSAQIGSITGSLQGNVIGNITGSITGSTAQFTSITGSLQGAIVGNFTGSITGSTAQFLSITGSLSGSRATIFSASFGTFNTIGDITIGQNNLVVGNRGNVNNLVIGSAALPASTTGWNFNTAIGNSSLFKLGPGAGNTAIGNTAGQSLISGSNNVLIGNYGGGSLQSGSNNTIIGVYGFATGSGNVVLAASNIFIADGTTNNIILGDGATNIRARYSGSWTLSTGVSSPSFSGSISGSSAQFGSITGSLQGDIVGNITGSITGSTAQFTSITGSLIGNFTGSITGSTAQIRSITGSNILIATTSGISALDISGSNTFGTPNLAFDFLRVANANANVINPFKFFRVGSSGSFEILSSGYNIISSLSDPGTLYISGGITIGTSSLDPVAPESLVLFQPTGSSYNAGSIKTKVNNYSQFYITNLSAGISASSDFVVQADNGSQTNMFADLGINSSGYTGNGNGVGNANDAYVYGKAKDFWVGNNTTGSLFFFANTGSNVADMTLKTNKLSLTGSFSISTTGPTSSLELVGSNTKGGAGYFDFLTVQNTSVGAIDPKKYFRINSTGSLEIVSNNYDKILLTVSSSGDLGITGSINVANNVSSSAVLTSTNGTGMNFRVGDDLWIGDVNLPNTMQVSGIQNSGSGYIKFGTGSSTPIIGASGTSILQLTGSLNVSGGITGSSIQSNGIYGTAIVSAKNTAGAIYISGSGTIGGTNYIDFLKITNNATGATNTSTTFRKNLSGTIEMINSAYNATVLSIDDSGSINTQGNGITMPNRSAFRAIGVGNTISATTIVSGSNYSVDYSQGTAWNTSTGKFTAPQDGLYQVNLVARISGNAFSQAQIRKTAISGGTVTTQIMIEWGVNTTANHIGGSTISKLAVGDTLHLEVTAGSISFDANDNFSVAYIG